MGAQPVDIVLLPSAARTATTFSADIDNRTNSNPGVLLTLNITSAGTGNIQLSLQGKDPISGSYYNIAYMTAQTATGLSTLIVYPSQSTTGNSYTTNASGVLPLKWRARVVSSDGSSWTYSVGGTLLPG